MYSCMLYQWCYTVDKCLYDRSDSTLSDLFIPCSCCPSSLKLEEPQLIRPSISGWYYPSVPGGSETQLHCVMLLAPNTGLEGNALGSRGILADEPFYLKRLTLDEPPTSTTTSAKEMSSHIPNWMCPSLKPSCGAQQALIMNICAFNVLEF